MFVLRALCSFEALLEWFEAFHGFESLASARASNEPCQASNNSSPASNEHNALQTNIIVILALVLKEEMIGRKCVARAERPFF